MTSEAPPPPNSPLQSRPPQPPPPSDPATPHPLTIDDVPRRGSGTGVAVGCAVLVLAAIAMFWLVRGWMMHA
jgi:hypothetical protein